MFIKWSLDLFCKWYLRYSKTPEEFGMQSRNKWEWIIQHNHRTQSNHEYSTIGKSGNSKINLLKVTYDFFLTISWPQTSVFVTIASTRFALILQNSVCSLLSFPRNALSVAIHSLPLSILFLLLKRIPVLSCNIKLLSAKKIWSKAGRASDQVNQRKSKGSFAGSETSWRQRRISFNLIH